MIEINVGDRVQAMQPRLGFRGFIDRFVSRLTGKPQKRVPMIYEVVESGCSTDTPQPS